VTSDAYSHSVNGALWQPTLLRSPKMAWGGGKPAVYAGRDQHSDQGAHLFRFGLWFGPHVDEADLVATVRRQAQPLVVFDRYEGMKRPSWGPVPPRTLWGPAVRRNIEEDLMVDPNPELRVPEFASAANRKKRSAERTKGRTR
jgi:alpha-mannosidase